MENVIVKTSEFGIFVTINKNIIQDDMLVDIIARIKKQKSTNLFDISAANDKLTITIRLPQVTTLDKIIEAATFANIIGEQIQKMTASNEITKAALRDMEGTFNGTKQETGNWTKKGPKWTQKKN